MANISNTNAGKNVTITGDLVVDGEIMCHDVTIDTSYTINTYTSGTPIFIDSLKTIGMCNVNGNAYYFFNNSISHAGFFFFDSASASDSQCCTINSAGVTAVSFNATSDYRIKEDIKPLKLEDYSIDNLNPICYYNSLSKKTDIGFLAHELQEKFPFLVTGEKDGSENQSVNYTGLIGVLTKETQELKNRVKNLEENNKVDRNTLTRLFQNQLQLTEKIKHK